MGNVHVHVYAHFECRIKPAAHVTYTRTHAESERERGKARESEREREGGREGERERDPQFESSY
jgi:hypothetical protein